MTSVVVLQLINRSCFQTESLQGFKMSDQECSLSDVASEPDVDDGDDDIVPGEILPYQNEPLATSSSSESEGSHDENDDEDGIPRFVLAQRFERKTCVENCFAFKWSTCLI